MDIKSSYFQHKSITWYCLSIFYAKTGWPFLISVIRLFYANNQNLFTHCSLLFSSEQGEHVKIVLSSDVEDSEYVLKYTNDYFQKIIKENPSMTPVDIFRYGYQLWGNYPNNSIEWNCFHLPVHLIKIDFIDFSNNISMLLMELYNNEISFSENIDTILGFILVNLCRSPFFNGAEVFGNKTDNYTEMIHCQLNDDLYVLDYYWNYPLGKDSNMRIKKIYKEWLNVIDAIYLRFGAHIGFNWMLSILYTYLNVDIHKRNQLFIILKEWFITRNKQSEQSKIKKIIGIKDKGITLSFCITCKNRLHQISQTLRKNLDDNKVHKSFIEFVLVDFGSTDGLRQWIVENFQNELHDNYLKYYYTDELPLWHAPIAKNTAHRLASNDILVNLDCDNYTGYEGGLYVVRLFAQRSKDIVIHQFSGKIYDGSFGRIALIRKSFFEVGGYDESFEPMSIHDEDLLLRLQSIGLVYVSCPNDKYNKAIANTKEEGLVNTGSNLDYESMLIKNKQLSDENFKAGRYATNNGIFGIRKNVFDIHGNRVKNG